MNTTLNATLFGYNNFTILLIYWVIPLPLLAQTNISGYVQDQHNVPVIGASIAIVDSYDGGITDERGYFQFDSFEEGIQTLLISYLGYQSQQIKKPIEELGQLKVVLKENIMTLDAVEISASTFKAGDNSKVAVLKPLDILTTAGSMGDVIAAMQTLPGTQSNPDDGRLFIRGGEARETNVYIDGMRVFSPFARTVSGTPTRGRYSPMLFKGVSFSTGGYSASLGQALSGVLDMETIDEPNDSETNLGVMTVGLMGGHTQKWDHQSISMNASYLNLGGYYWALPSRVDWLKPFSNLSGESIYRLKTKNGLLKSYLSGELSNFEISRLSIDGECQDTVAIRNKNIYSNTTYKGIISDQTSFFAGVSLGYNDDRLSTNLPMISRKQLNGIHTRASFKTIIGDRLVLQYGVDDLRQINLLKTSFEDAERSIDLNQSHSALFIESDYFFSQKTAIKTGLRAEHNGWLKRTFFYPRVTIAQKLNDITQVSFAYGRFSQSVDPDYLAFDQSLLEEEADHWLLNINLKTENQILRIEPFYKRYRKLLKFQSIGDQIENLTNEGTGEAYGIDFFWRANQLFENLDFWISYSWIENERDYRDFPVRATPNYSTKHNLSFVSKIWIQELKSQVGLTFNVISGRPYENPNTIGFMNERSKMFKNISLSWAYLLTQQKILFFSISNPTGFRNEFGYEYASQMNEEGIFPGRIIRPNDDQFFFVGFFMTISKDKAKNQLDRL